MFVIANIKCPVVCPPYLLCLLAFLWFPICHFNNAYIIAGREINIFA